MAIAMALARAKARASTTTYLLPFDFKPHLLLSLMDDEADSIYLRRHSPTNTPTRQPHIIFDITVSYM